MLHQDNNIVVYPILSRRLTNRLLAYHHCQLILYFVSVAGAWTYHSASLDTSDCRCRHTALCSGSVAQSGQVRQLRTLRLVDRIFRPFFFASFVVCFRPMPSFGGDSVAKRCRPNFTTTLRRRRCWRSTNIRRNLDHTHCQCVCRSSRCDINQRPLAKTRNPRKLAPIIQLVPPSDLLEIRSQLLRFGHEFGDRNWYLIYRYKRDERLSWPKRFGENTFVVIRVPQQTRTRKAQTF